MAKLSTSERITKLIICLIFVVVGIFALINFIEFIRILRADQEYEADLSASTTWFLIIANGIIMSISFLCGFIFLYYATKGEKPEILKGFEKRLAYDDKEILERQKAFAEIQLKELQDQIKGIKIPSPKTTDLFGKSKFEKVTLCAKDSKPTLPILDEKKIKKIDLLDLAPKTSAITSPSRNEMIQTLKAQYIRKKELGL